jgi:hypothetical protein
MDRTRLVAGLAAAAAFFACAVPAGAATVTWTGSGGDNLWSNAANWNPGLPGSADDVVIPSGATVSLNTAGTTQVHSISADTTSTLFVGGQADLVPATASTFGAVSLIGPAHLGGAGETMNGYLTITGNSQLEGTGTTQILAGATVTSNGSGGGVISRPVVVAAQKLFQVDNRLILLVGNGNAGGAITVDGELQLLTGGTLEQSNIGSSAVTIDHGGDLYVSGGAIPVGGTNYTITNDGMVIVAAGSLTINDSHISGSGDWSLATGTSLALTGADSTSITGRMLGPGAVTVSTGGAYTTTTTGEWSAPTTVHSGSLELDGTAPVVAPLTVSGGTVQGSASLQPTALTWSLGTIAGPGASTSDPGLELPDGAHLKGGQIAGIVPLTLGRNAVLPAGATLTHDGLVELDLDASAGLSIHGTWNMGDASAIASASGASHPTVTVESDGTLAKPTGVGTATIDASAPLTVAGTVQAEQGRLQLGSVGGFSGGVITGGTFFADGGIVQVPDAIVTNRANLHVGLGGAIESAIGVSALATLATNDVDGRLEAGPQMSIAVADGFSNAGTLAVTDGGPIAGSSGITANTIVAGGTVEVAIDPAYTPMLGDADQYFVHSTGMTGTFAAITGQTTSGAVALTVVYPGDGATLHVGPASTGGATVQTGGATSVQPDRATLSGTITTPATATYHFEYGPTKAYGTSTPNQTVGASSNAPVASIVHGLAGSTLYHYRLVAVVNNHTSAGADATFTTMAPVYQIQADQHIFGTHAVFSVTGGVPGGTYQVSFLKGSAVVDGPVQRILAPDSTTYIDAYDLDPGTAYTIRIVGPGTSGGSASFPYTTLPGTVPSFTTPPAITGVVGDSAHNIEAVYGDTATCTFTADGSFTGASVDWLLDGAVIASAHQGVSAPHGLDTVASVTIPPLALTQAAAGRPFRVGGSTLACRATLDYTTGPVIATSPLISYRNTRGEFYDIDNGYYEPPGVSGRAGIAPLDATEDNVNTGRVPGYDEPGCYVSTTAVDHTSSVVVCPLQIPDVALGDGNDDFYLWGATASHPITIDLGSGDDTLEITDAWASSITVTGGPGKDTITTGDGNDTINLVDGAGGDTVTCGGGIDTVNADTGDTVASDCENVSRVVALGRPPIVLIPPQLGTIKAPPAPNPPITVPATCVASTVCSTVITIIASLPAKSLAAAGAAKTKTVVLATKKVTLKKGHRRKVVLHLSKSGRKLLKKLHTIKATVLVTQNGAYHTRATSTRAVKLRYRK